MAKVTKAQQKLAEAKANSSSAEEGTNEPTLLSCDERSVDSSVMHDLTTPEYVSNSKAVTGSGRGHQSKKGSFSSTSSARSLYSSPRRQFNGKRVMPQQTPEKSPIPKSNEVVDIEGGPPLEARVLFQDRGGDSPSTPPKPTDKAAAWSQSIKDAYKFNFQAPSPYKDARQKQVKGGDVASVVLEGSVFSAYAKKPSSLPANIPPIHFGSSSTTPSTSIDSSLTSSVVGASLKASSYKGVPHIQKKIFPIDMEEQETIKKIFTPGSVPIQKGWIDIRVLKTEDDVHDLVLHNSHELYS